MFSFSVKRDTSHTTNVSAVVEGAMMTSAALRRLRYCDCHLFVFGMRNHEPNIALKLLIVVLFTFHQNIYTL